MNSGAGFGNLLVLALPLLLLAFLMLTQRKRGREVQTFQSGLAVGDAVVMTSGLYGTTTPPRSWRSPRVSRCASTAVPSAWRSPPW